MDPVELVDEQPAHEGWELILRSETDLTRFVLSASDEASLAVARGLPRAGLDAEELERLRERLDAASQPIDADWERRAGEQIKRKKPTSWLDRATGWSRP